MARNDKDKGISIYKKLVEQARGLKSVFSFGVKKAKRESTNEVSRKGNITGEGPASERLKVLLEARKDHPQSPFFEEIRQINSKEGWEKFADFLNEYEGILNEKLHDLIMGEAATKKSEVGETPTIYPIYHVHKEIESLTEVWEKLNGRWNEIHQSAEHKQEQPFQRQDSVSTERSNTNSSRLSQQSTNSSFATTISANSQEGLTKQQSPSFIQRGPQFKPLLSEQQKQDLNERLSAGFEQFNFISRRFGPEGQFMRPGAKEQSISQQALADYRKACIDHLQVCDHNLQYVRDRRQWLADRSEQVNQSLASPDTAPTAIGELTAEKNALSQELFNLLNYEQRVNGDMDRERQAIGDIDRLSSKIAHIQAQPQAQANTRVQAQNIEGSSWLNVKQSDSMAKQSPSINKPAKSQEYVYRPAAPVGLQGMKKATNQYTPENLGYDPVSVGALRKMSKQDFNALVEHGLKETNGKMKKMAIRPWNDALPKSGDILTHASQDSILYKPASGRAQKNKKCPTYHLMTTAQAEQKLGYQRGQTAVTQKAGHGSNKSEPKRRSGI